MIERLRNLLRFFWPQLQHYRCDGCGAATARRWFQLVDGEPHVEPPVANDPEFWVCARRGAWSAA